MGVTDEFVCQQLEAVERPAARQRVLDYLVQTCWPGGGADGTIQAARAWVPSWRPERSAIDLTACRCDTGRCRICN